jgi:NADH-quinone oxidoreductase subunit L
MEGPTPVSALLHAATMVTAGVYLIIRFFFIFELSPFARSFIFIVGLSTIVLSSLIALTQYDIKKIIAYSTCSQLGLMFLACGLSAYNFALYHFFNHAFFKCLLFLIAGAVIHQLHNEQDIRKMGGLANKMPFTFICFLIASMSLVGFPGFSGAISKDCILHILNYYAVQAPSVAASLRIFSLNIIIYLTVAYSARLLYYVFLAPAAYRNGSFAKSYMDSGLKEKAFFIVFFFLAIASIFSGRLFKDYFFFTTEAIFINVNAEVCSFAHSIFLQNAAVDSWCLYIPFFLTLHALFTACYIIYYKLKNNHRPVYYNHNSF